MTRFFVRNRRRLGGFAFGGGDVVEADQVDFFAAAMFGYLQEIEHSEKAGCAGEFGCDVGEAYGVNGVDLDLAFFHGVASADFYARGLPDADAQGDVSATNAVAETLGEHHGREFTRRAAPAPATGSLQPNRVLLIS